MIVRPKQFYIVALALVLLAVSFPVQVVYLYDHSFTEVDAIVSKISFLNWLVIGGLITLSYLHLKASKLLMVAAPLLIFLVGLNNYVVGQFASDYSMGQTMAATSLFSLLFTPLFLPSSRLIFKDPTRRWWVRSKRYHKKISTTINPYVGDMLHAYTFDISETGAFISFEDLPPEDMPKVGDHIRVSFNVNSMRKIRCEAIVVRLAEPKGRYPQGLGLRFVGFDKNHQKNFHQVLKSSKFLM